MNKTYLPRTTEQKLRTKIRLLLARVVMMDLRHDEVRDVLSRKGWVPGSAIIPCEWDTPFQEVRSSIEQRISKGETAFLVPVVVRENGEKRFGIKTLIVSNVVTDSFWSLKMDQVHPSRTMQEVWEVLNPDKHWSIENLDEDDSRELTRLLDMAS